MGIGETRIDNYCQSDNTRLLESNEKSRSAARSVSLFDFFFHKPLCVLGGVPLTVCLLQLSFPIKVVFAGVILSHVHF